MTDDKTFKDKKIETRLIHAGRVEEDRTGSVTTPIFPSSTYRVAYPGDESGYVYSRWSNPTRVALEKSLAELENGSHASRSDVCEDFIRADLGSGCENHGIIL